MHVVGSAAPGWIVRCWQGWAFGLNKTWNTPICESWVDGTLKKFPYLAFFFVFSLSFFFISLVLIFVLGLLTWVINDVNKLYIC